ncbi:MAG: DotA/TraY family protein, partial [Pseudomonadota bacterium]
MILALTSGKIIRYMTLPGIAPRLREFISKGFDNLAYYIALVYRAVNILPINHPYTQRQNIGKYGVARVLGEAASHLSFDRQNIDKIIIFFLILAGLVLLFLQFLFLLVAIMIGSAVAQIPTSYQGFIETPSPETDIAFRLLRKVFGIPGIFGEAEGEVITTGFHTAIHSLFQYYSTGILVIAGIILAYFIFVVLAETAQTGTPFGKRFNHVWAPIRLVVGIGLLIPVSYGMNSAQWITLYAAKFGSGFASQGWVRFHETSTSETRTYLGEKEDLIATPEAPRVRELAQFMMIAHACKYAYETDSDFIREGGGIEPYLVKQFDGGSHAELTSYENALDFYNNGTILIRFGWRHETHNRFIGNVMPLCGDLILSPTSVPGSAENEEGDTVAVLDGADVINKGYFDLVIQMWDTGYFGTKFHAQNYVKRNATDNTLPAPLPGPNFISFVIRKTQEKIEENIKAGVEAQIQQITVKPNYAIQGWAGAGIWYNQISQYNGGLIAAAANVPTPRQMPYVMEFYRYKNLQADENANLNLFGNNDSTIPSTLLNDE